MEGERFFSGEMKMAILAVFEFECEGTIDGEKYQGRIAIALDVSTEKICGFREYFGDVDW